MIGFIIFNKKIMAKKEEKIVEIDVNKGLALISYIWILCLIPLLLKRKDEFVGHHAKQGLVLFVFEIILMVVGVIPLLGWLLAFVGWILAVVLAIMGIINVLAGKKWVMPILGKYADKLKF